MADGDTQTRRKLYRRRRHHGLRPLLVPRRGSEGAGGDQVWRGNGIGGAGRSLESRGDLAPRSGPPLSATPGTVPGQPRGAGAARGAGRARDERGGGGGPGARPREAGTLRRFVFPGEPVAERGDLYHLHRTWRPGAGTPDPVRALLATPPKPYRASGGRTGAGADGRGCLRAHERAALRDAFRRYARSRRPVLRRSV